MNQLVVYFGIINKIKRYGDLGFDPIFLYIRQRNLRHL